MLIDCPFYPWFQGTPYVDAEKCAIDTVLQFALQKLNFIPEHIILFGWSIGGFASSFAATNYPDVRAVVNKNISCTYLPRRMLFIQNVLREYERITKFITWLFRTPDIGCDIRWNFASRRQANAQISRAYCECYDTRSFKSRRCELFESILWTYFTHKTIRRWNNFFNVRIFLLIRQVYSTSTRIYGPSRSFMIINAAYVRRAHIFNFS